MGLRTRGEPSVIGRGRRCVAAVLVVPLLLIACTVARQAAIPEQAERLERVRTIALAPPRAEVFREFIGVETEVSEWSRDAERNLTAALVKQLELGGRFAVTVLPEDEQAPALPSGFEIPGEARHESLNCLASPVPDLAERAGADALLLVRGKDHVYAHRWGSALVGLLMIGLTPFGIYLGLAANSPGAAVLVPFLGGESIRHTVTGGSAEVVMCLVEPRSGDVLWAARRRAKGTRDLRDPASAERLVEQTLGDLTRGGLGP